VVCREYNKLVRDRIPEIIQVAGKACAVQTLTMEAFDAALCAKFVEEANEVSVAPPEQLLPLSEDLRDCLLPMQVFQPCLQLELCAELSLFAGHFFLDKFSLYPFSHLCPDFPRTKIIMHVDLAPTLRHMR
jgi:hypothetical protein